jgi:hypothetical protein
MVRSNMVPSLQDHPGEGGRDDWSQDLRNTGADPNANEFREPNRIDRTRWGARSIIEIVHTAAGPIDGDGTRTFAQLINAQYHLPVGWLIGFEISIQAAQPGAGDSAIFQGSINVGVGSIMFKGAVPLGGSIPATNLPSVIIPFGPIAAQTLFVDGIVTPTAGGGGSFPRTNLYRLGAFAAPHVWAR